MAGAAKEKAPGSKEAVVGGADIGDSGGDGTRGSGGGGEDMSLIDDENPAVLAHDESQVCLYVWHRKCVYMSVVGGRVGVGLLCVCYKIKPG